MAVFIKAIIMITVDLFLENHAAEDHQRETRANRALKNVHSNHRSFGNTPALSFPFPPLKTNASPSIHNIHTPTNPPTTTQPLPAAKHTF